tara:strand:- start:2772 stop:3578 length:807 start_codon:yes stop_codon:yes gene_type:complete
MKALIILLLLASSLGANTSYNIDDIMPKRGTLRLNNAITFVKTSSLLANTSQLIEEMELQYGLMNNTQINLDASIYSIWDRTLSNNQFSTKQDDRLGAVTIGILKSYIPKNHDYGLMVSMKTPVIYNEYFYDNRKLIKEENNLNFITYNVSFYTVISPLTPTLQVQYKNYLSSQYKEKKYVRGDEINIGLTINFSINDDVTLLWGTNIKNTKKNKLNDSVIEDEKNQMTFLYGAIYELNKKLLFQIISSFSQETPNVASFSVYTLYKL